MIIDSLKHLMCRPQMSRKFLSVTCLLSLYLLALPSMVWSQAATPAEPPKNVVEALPEHPPAWPDGYQLRYTLRVVGLNVAASTSQSIVARLPTGGWLKPDGSDITVLASDGSILPVALLSHMPYGDTLIQFPRHGADVWYWAFAVNPAATVAIAEPLPEGLV